MKQKSCQKTLWTLLCVAFLCSLFTLTSHAAKVETVCNYISKKTTFYRDITGDGKSDTITITPKLNSYDYVTGVQVHINGKKALDQNIRHMSYGLTVKFFSMTTTNTFLQIYTHGDNNYAAYNKIFKSNKKGNKLTCALDLSDFLINGGKVEGASSKQIKVTFSTQPGETGRINWNYIYTYKNGKFKLKSNTATVKSSLTKYDPGDGYTKYFKQSKFVAQKNLTFYKKTNLKSISFTAKNGTVLKLKKIKIVDNSIYLQFQKGSKKGWQKVNQEMGWFYGVTNRLAG